MEQPVVRSLPGPGRLAQGRTPEEAADDSPTTLRIVILFFVTNIIARGMTAPHADPAGAAEGKWDGSTPCRQSKVPQLKPQAQAPDPRTAFCGKRQRAKTITDLPGIF